MEAGTMLVSILSSAVSGLVVGLFIYLLMPKLMGKFGKYMNPITLGVVADGIDKLQAIKSSVDTDSKSEDMVEKLLRYSEYAVLAAKQSVESSANNANQDRKAFAVQMASNLLKQYKISTGAENPDVTEFEKSVIAGLIETVVAGSKKAAALNSLPVKS